MSEQIFYVWQMPASRPADYCLGYWDGSVFIDFDNFGNDRIRLKGISFDGYGYFGLKHLSFPLELDESAVFKEIMRSEILDQDKLLAIVKKAIHLNKEGISANAISDYNLL